MADEAASGEERVEDRIAALEAERNALEAEQKAVHDRLLRVAAECENWKKRAEKDRAEGERRAREELLLELVRVVDDLERALASLAEGADPRAVREGVALVLRDLKRDLERRGIRPVEAVGQRFDPRLHDAVNRTPAPDVPPGTVVAETRRGYLVGDRLLRPASVVVATA